MAKNQKFGNKHLLVFAAVAVLAFSSIIMWAYVNRNAQLARNDKPITTAKQAESSARQTSEDLKNMNIDSDLDTSEIDALLQ